MGENPLVSVIIPTYNRGHLIGRAIHSVLAQTYQDFEVVVVDDGSTDNTEAVVKELDDARIRCLRHVQNRGVAAARNTGVAASCGPYVAFLDSDDEWRPVKLRRQVTALETAPDDVGVVCVDMWRIREGQRKYGNSRNCPAAGSALVKRGCLADAGPVDEGLPSLEDVDLFLRLAEHCCFIYLHQPLVHYYDTPGSLSSDAGVLAEALDLIVAKHAGLRVGEKRRLMATYLYEIGSRLCQNGYFRRGRKHLVTAARQGAWKPLYLAAAALSLLGEDMYLGGVRARRVVLLPRAIPNGLDE